MSQIYPQVDPEGLMEYSVVFTDRSLNHMSPSFQRIMREISATLREVYQAESVAVVPGSGTFGMEAVARQFASGQKCLVIQNGLFSFRWSQIFEAGHIPSSWSVLKAEPLEDAYQTAFTPCPIEKAVKAIKDEKPRVVFAPHVETSAGMMLSDDYIKTIGEAVHETGGLFVLDCIASGTIWCDMKALGVDVLISAPQKGWSGTPCCGLVMLGGKALDRLEETESTSFACDLKKWHAVMKAYVSGGHAYHATMPTDGLKYFHDVMKETEAFGFDRAREAQAELGARVRRIMAGKGYKSLAASGFEAPGVVVCYTDDPGIPKKFAAQGLQIAAGVPIKCDERDDFQTFRIGLFGLDKLKDIDRTVSDFEKALEGVNRG